MKNSRCEICGKEELIPFKCAYCGGLFCGEHRLPERHKCPNLPNTSPPYIQPSEARTYELPPPLNHPFPKQHFNLQLIKKIIVGFFQFTAFSVFTFTTGLPLLMYLCMITVPEFASSLGLIYLFSGNGFLWYILIPNIGYVIMWFFTVYKILRGRAEWWYHLLLLIFGLWSWWGLFRVILVQTFLGGILG